MVDVTPQQQDNFLGKVAAATVVVIAVAAGAGLLYYLVDILLLLFLGIIVSATLQPWHVKLCNWGVPRGLAIVLIYLLFIGVLVAVAILVAPLVIEQISMVAAQAPQAYVDLRDHLSASNAGISRVVGRRLPSYETLIASMVALSPTFFQSIVQLTASIITTLAYVVAVFALGIYWTLELPRVERLLVSLVPVSRRAHTLTIWHEIESKLGGFMRGQFLVMLSVGFISAIGYVVIGLPNVLVLGVLAALFEAVPLVGPVLAAVPALLVALPLGMPTVFTVIGFATVVQLLESNLLVPRIMHGAVGTSALIGLFAVLAFGTLYGIMGVFIAIPIAAVVQVIVDRLVINGEPDLAAATMNAPQVDALLARVRQLRQQARTRLRARETRMGFDPDSADHVVDAADQRVEGGRAVKAHSTTQMQLTAGTDGAGSRGGPIRGCHRQAGVALTRFRKWGPRRRFAGRTGRGQVLRDAADHIERTVGGPRRPGGRSGHRRVARGARAAGASGRGQRRRRTAPPGRLASAISGRRRGATDRLDDLPQRGTVDSPGMCRCAPHGAQALDVVDAAHQPHLPLVSEKLIDRSDAPGETADRRHTQHAGLAHHRAAAADHQIGGVNQRRTVQRLRRDAHPPIAVHQRAQAAPLMVGARQHDDAYAGLRRQALQEPALDHRPDVVSVVGVVGARPEHDEDLVIAQAQPAPHVAVGAKAVQVDVFLQPVVALDDRARNAGAIERVGWQDTRCHEAARGLPDGAGGRVSPTRPRRGCLRAAAAACIATHVTAATSKRCVRAKRPGWKRAQAVERPLSVALRDMS
jgi:predicted PurR-regulated permease PerM